jgi:putative endonuclease
MEKDIVTKIDSPYKQKIGKLAELEACQFLQAKGLCLLVKNYRCYHGEIDLIMKEQEDIVFIEVRSRSRTDFGNASETIDKRKQSKLIKAATHFLQKKEWLFKVNSRFDVVAIQFKAGKLELEWIKNAF